MCKLYKTWRRAKDTFVKPSFKIRLTTTLSRRTPIYVCPRRKQYKYTHLVGNTHLVYVGDKATSCYHKFPKSISGWQSRVWNSNVRRKLRHWKLGWLPPIMWLPRWLDFHINNCDVGWKMKYGDARYEFPPEFSITIFGITLSVTLHCPIKGGYASDDQYWEAILNYLYTIPNKNLDSTIRKCGVWTQLDNKTKFFAVRPEYIKEKYHSIYEATTNKIREATGETIL